jgi:hypothetical protein
MLRVLPPDMAATRSHPSPCHTAARTDTTLRRLSCWTAPRSSSAAHHRSAMATQCPAAGGWAESIRVAAVLQTYTHDGTAGSMLLHAQAVPPLRVCRRFCVARNLFGQVDSFLYDEQCDAAFGQLPKECFDTCGEQDQPASGRQLLLPMPHAPPWFPPAHCRVSQTLRSPCPMPPPLPRCARLRCLSGKILRWKPAPALLPPPSTWASEFLGPIVKQPPKPYSS